MQVLRNYGDQLTTATLTVYPCKFATQFEVLKRLYINSPTAHFATPKLQGLVASKPLVLGLKMYGVPGPLGFEEPGVESQVLVIYSSVSSVV